MKILREDGKIKVESPYSEAFIKRARELKGKFDRPYWVFDEKVAEPLNTALLSIYGEGFEPVEQVEILISLDDFKKEHDEHVVFKGMTLARRLERDSQVRLSENAYLIEGAFESSGGSTKYPKVTWKPGSIICAKVPVTFTSDLPKGVSIKESQSLKEKLLAEKEAIVKRLAEINMQLEEMK